MNASEISCIYKLFLCNVVNGNVYCSCFYYLREPLYRIEESVTL